MSNSEPTFYPFRISIVKYNGSRQIFGGVNAQDSKSMAGNELRQKNVKSVYVGDILGNKVFYRVKDENGHVIKDKNVDMPSDIAQAVWSTVA